jgi:hypothetical protein
MKFQNNSPNIMESDNAHDKTVEPCQAVVVVGWDNFRLDMIAVADCYFR